MHRSWECTWSFWFPGICGSFSKPLLSKDSHPLAFPPNLFGVLFAPTVIHCLMQHQLINFLLINVFNKLLPSSHFLALAKFWIRQDKVTFCASLPGHHQTGKNKLLQFFVNEVILRPLVLLLVPGRQTYFQDHHWAGEWGNATKLTMLTKIQLVFFKHFTVIKCIK